MDRLLKHRILGLTIGSLLTFVFLDLIMTQFPKYLNLIILIGTAIAYIVGFGIGILMLIGITYSGIQSFRKWKRKRRG